MGDPVLRDLLIESVRRNLGLSADAPLPATIKVEQAAKVLGIGRGTAFDAARRGELPTIRLGRRLVVPVARLLALLDGSPGQGQAVENGKPEEPLPARIHVPSRKPSSGEAF